MQSQSDRIGGDKHIKCVRHLRDIEPEEGHFCFELTKSNLLNFNTYESKSLTILARWKVDIFHFIFRLFGFMRISLLRISLLQFFKTITKIWLMPFYGLFVLLI